MKNTIMNWGGPSGLRTKIVEGSFSATAETLSSPAQTPEDIVTHLFVAKLNAATETMPSTAPACPSQTNCTNVEVIDSEHHRTTGLAPGQYACWNPISYAMCQRTNWQSKATLAGASFSFSCAD